jgi:hypothetical protein
VSQMACKVSRRAGQGVPSKHVGTSTAGVQGPMHPGGTARHTGKMTEDMNWHLQWLMGAKQPGAPGRKPSAPAHLQLRVQPIPQQHLRNLVTADLHLRRQTGRWHTCRQGGWLGGSVGERADRAACWHAGWNSTARMCTRAITPAPALAWMPA